MKIMIISSIRGKNANQSAINRIVSVLNSDDHTVFADHLINTSQEKLDEMRDEDNVAFHNKILSKIKHSDIIIAECSHESFSVGYLLSYAIELAKPTIIFYSSSSPEPNLVPTLLQSGKILLVKYESIDQLNSLVHEYVDYAKEKVDVRFNFFISPAISRYLDWVSRVKKIPRSVYLRALIETEIKDNKEYKDE